MPNRGYCVSYPSNIFRNTHGSEEPVLAGIYSVTGACKRIV